MTVWSERRAANAAAVLARETTPADIPRASTAATVDESPPAAAAPHVTTVPSVFSAANAPLFPCTASTPRPSAAATVPSPPPASQLPQLTTEPPGPAPVIFTHVSYPSPRVSGFEQSAAYRRHVCVIEWYSTPVQKPVHVARQESRVVSELLVRGVTSSRLYSQDAEDPARTQVAYSPSGVSVGTGVGAAVDGVGVGGGM
eukprot:gene14985-biopygen15056